MGFHFNYEMDEDKISSHIKDFDHRQSLHRHKAFGSLTNETEKLQIKEQGCIRQS